MIRLFVAIRPPEDIRDLMVDAMDEDPAFRWQSDEQLHLTLRFIGEVDRPLAEDVAAALESVRVPPFSLRLAGLGSFDHRGGGSLWADVDPRDEVIRLAAKIERACQSAGLAPEHRAYRPHITLARWSGPRSREARAFLANRSLTSPPFEVTEFTLYQSHLSRHGARYDPVASYPLSV
jgi:2'-5' RNA ligase